ncbi:60S ribosomal protein L27e, putative [Theileria equi strain WA]|uniref:60S ribosomal protein L27e, putative n=1 Tax=Theileria equi strain WA TaxID=1537102 RepID=L0ATJ5_THEEQ|nr:60S ribosomal protein L27e, putative [Theileria equi strain WA]AFZ78962.1 60S ribosomal protein L27e, putative [Theileria equi strain WA]|eukprot:XP_004828628.1 60S ribosomal protein L27e, putative [Theileria equi strain WA]
MGKLLRPGRIVIVLSGRRAGCKGIIVQTNENSSKRRPYSNCLIAGIEKPPRKVTKKMSKTKVEKRLKIKTFVKYINVNHLMPTRYMVSSSIDPKSLVTDEQMENKASRKSARKAVKLVLEECFSKPESADSSAKGSKDTAFLKKKLRF